MTRWAGFFQDNASLQREKSPRLADCESIVVSKSTSLGAAAAPMRGQLVLVNGRQLSALDLAVCTGMCRRVHRACPQYVTRRY